VLFCVFLVAASYANEINAYLNTTDIPTFTKGNGIFQIEWNGLCPFIAHKYPVVTRMWVNGELIIPNIGDGATMQMDVRSNQGNAYNPTQGGDCAGYPSALTGYIPNWSMGLGISPTMVYY